jgi:hypothetical protein
MNSFIHERMESFLQTRLGGGTGIVLAAGEDGEAPVVRLPSPTAPPPRRSSLVPLPKQ